MATVSMCSESPETFKGAGHRKHCTSAQDGKGLPADSGVYPAKGEHMDMQAQADVHAHPHIHTHARVSSHASAHVPQPDVRPERISKLLEAMVKGCCHLQAMHFLCTLWLFSLVGVCCSHAQRPGRPGAAVLHAGWCFRPPASVTQNRTGADLQAAQWLAALAQMERLLIGNLYPQSQHGESISPRVFCTAAFAQNAADGLVKVQVALGNIASKRERIKILYKKKEQFILSQVALLEQANNLQPFLDSAHIKAAPDHAAKLQRLAQIHIQQQELTELFQTELKSLR
ncbi:hypothetical protein KIL84_013202 [Mauremys mutica]|uniref:Uncharacterized protein n=1 Tax=Mauremys mutica TaxID=74926 RepID=A0A9D4AN33_9SAUR|nr:hypothetical protein KIL84_013202 [Mauremys mutica]